MRSMFFLSLLLAVTQSECFLSTPSSLPISIRTRQRQEQELSNLHELSAIGKGGFFFDKDSSDNLEDASFASWLQGGRRRRRRRQEEEEEQQSALRRQRMELESARESRFLSGDELQKLRQQVLDLRHELQTAPLPRKRELEQTILQAQQMDAEFIYQVASERAEAAEFAGLHLEAANYRREASDARAALPQFNLEGLWVGKYHDHGFEIINCTYQGDTLIATKITGDQNVPKGELTFQVDLSPAGTRGIEATSSFPGNSPSGPEHEHNLFPMGLDASETPGPLEPIELNQEAAEQWGSRYLQRFQGMGQVASSDFRNSQWMEGQLILVGTSYFSFAWLPIGHQVFFGRPSPEMTLQLLREAQREDEPVTQDRQHLDLCWEETELLEDDMEVSDGLFVSNDQQEYFSMDGCFE